MNAPTTTNLGFPRIGHARELKRAVEGHWAGRVSADELQSVARELRERHWRLQVDAGIEHVPSSDFALYDHVLDSALMLDCVPEARAFPPHRDRPRPSGRSSVASRSPTRVGCRATGRGA
jgi:hypothetical protein